MLGTSLDGRSADPQHAAFSPHAVVLHSCDYLQAQLLDSGLVWMRLGAGEGSLCCTAADQLGVRLPRGERVRLDSRHEAQEMQGALRRLDIECEALCSLGCKRHNPWRD